MSTTQLGNEYVLAGGDVIAGEELDLIRMGHVVVRDGVIAAVGTGAPPSGLPVIDMSGRLLIPGLINCHTHIGDAAFKEKGFGFPTETNLLWQPDGLRWKWMAETPRSELVAAMRRAAQHMLSMGVVAFADFREGGYEGVIALRDACHGLPIRAIIYARHADAPLHTEEAFNENREGLSEEHLAEITRCLDVADGFSAVWANETTDLGLQQTASLVRDTGKRLATHACESDTYRQLSLARTGRGDVDRVVDHLMPDFVVHMTDANDAELDTAINAGLPMVFCGRGMAALGNGFVPYASALAKGALIGLGTDNVMINSPDILAEMDFLGRVNRALTHDTAIDARALLAAGTIDAARVLGLDDELGSISEGKSATLVAFDFTSGNLSDSADPIASLVERASVADIDAVVVDGALVHGSIRK
ncbi:amidohydrolase family protein [Parafrigoribacterium mesophilum]|uniref:amidohydrolase family protein n=1 Tax=Parafrigoribacterium mesophilum TaxID=433646 RepID=UPI0031FCAF05